MRRESLCGLSAKKKGRPSHKPAFLVTTNVRLRGGDFQPLRDACPHPTITTPNVPRTLDRTSAECQTHLLNSPPHSRLRCERCPHFLHMRKLIVLTIRAKNSAQIRLQSIFQKTARHWHGLSSRWRSHFRIQNKLGVVPTSASTRSINSSLSFSGALTARLTGWLFIFDAGNGVSNFSNTAWSVFGSSQTSKDSGPRIAGIRSWSGSISSFAGVVMIAHDLIDRSRPLHWSQSPAKANCDSSLNWK